jgi:endoglucanase
VPNGLNNSTPWLGTKWTDTEAERETIRKEFAYALQFSETHNIPIHIGEFGAYSKADAESRSKWTTFVSRWFEEQSFSWAYWEFSAGFGIYNPNTKQLNTSLVNALLHNPMPRPNSHYCHPDLPKQFSIWQ